MANYKRGKKRSALKKEQIFRRFKYKRKTNDKEGI